MAVKYLDDLHASGSVYFDEVASDGNVGSTSGYSMLVIEDSTSKVRSAVIPVGASTPSLQDVTDVGTTTTNVITFNNDVYVEGLLGVGTTSPSASLDVAGQHLLKDNFDDTGAIFRRNGSYGSVVALGRQGLLDGVTLDYPAENTLGFSTNGSERFRITSSGNIGMGTTNPIYKLHIVGNNTSNNTDSFVFENSNGSDSLKWSNAGQLELNTNNSNALIVKRSNGQAFVSLRNETTNGNNGYVQYLRSGTGRFSQGTYRDGSSNDHFGLSTDTSVNSAGNFIFSFARADGQMTLHKYGSNTFTGTVAKYLAVDSSGNVIEADAGGGGGSTPTLQQVLDTGNVAANTSFLVEDSSGYFIDFSRGTASQLGIEMDEIYMSAENTLWQYGTKVQIGGNSIDSETDSNFIGVGKGTTGATYSMRFQNLDKSEYMEFNDAGRFQMYSSNSIPLVIGRPNGNAVLQFRNDANEGSITYYGNGSPKWGTGVIQKSSTDFIYNIAQANGNADLPSMDNIMQLFSGGQVFIPKYGAGNMVGSGNYLLAVDGTGMIVESTQSIPNLLSGVTTSTTDGSGNITLSHSLGDTPTGVSIQMTASISGFNTPFAVATVTNRTSSNITINFTDGRGVTVSFTSVSFSYILTA